MRAVSVRIVRCPRVSLLVVLCNASTSERTVIIIPQNMCRQCVYEFTIAQYSDVCLNQEIF